MTEHDRRIADRIKAILLADKGWSYQDIAEALRISEGSVGRFLKEYLNHHKLKTENGGRQSKLNESQALEIKQHTLYLHQAGLTEDMLGITTGLKQRTLSLAEQRAKITVELYSEVAKDLLPVTFWKNE